MGHDKKNLKFKTDHLLPICLILMTLVWLVDSTIDANLYREAAGHQRLLFIDPREAPYHVLFFVVQLILIVCAWRVITKKRSLQDALESAMHKAEEEKARSDAILAALGDGVSIQGTDFKVLYQNQAHRELSGGGHVGKYCYHAYEGRQDICDGCPVALAFQDGMVHKLEKALPPGGNVSHIEIIASPLRDASGEIIAGIELVRDITDRKAAEKRLRKHQTAMEVSMDGIAILNKNEEYIYMNQAHARIFGYDTSEELMGKSWRVLYEEDEVARLEPEVKAGFREKGGWCGEAIGKRRDGSTFPQEVSLTLMESGGVVCIVRDITDRKLVEEEIQKLNEDLERRALDLSASNRELEAFGYSVSHDLRAPLTRIYSAGQALMEDYAGQLDDIGRFFIQTVCEASEHMEELIDALLLLSRVSSGEMRCEETDLTELVRGIVAELQITQPDRKAEFIIASGIKADCDPHLLKVALENMLGNAWKYTRDVPEVRIEFGVKSLNGRTVYYVRDNGAGFDMKDADDLFTPFKRLHSSREFPGTGIGLATVERVIRRHGGRVWGEGEVNKGATFYFTLK